MNVETPMSDEIYNAFDEPSIVKVWNILRKVCMMKLLGNDVYCPVPYIHRPQNYDLFNVYTKTSLKFVEKLKTMIGSQQSQFSYVGKLGDFLEYPTSKDKDMVASSSVVTEETFGHFPPHFIYHTKSRDGTKEIKLEINGFKRYIGNTVSAVKMYANLGRLQLVRHSMKNSIYVVNNVCAADFVSLTFRFDFPTLKSEQHFVFKGPVPIAIRLRKFGIIPNGLIRNQELVVTNEIYPQNVWKDKSKSIQLPECVSLKLHLQGKKSDATRKTSSLEKLRTIAGGTSTYIKHQPPSKPISHHEPKDEPIYENLRDYMYDAEWSS